MIKKIFLGMVLLDIQSMGSQYISKVSEMIENISEVSDEAHLIYPYKNNIKLKNLSTKHTLDKVKISKPLLIPKVISKRITLYKFFLNYCRKLREEGNIVIVFIRYPFSDPLFWKLLKKIKMCSSFLILDIPTYPYDHVLKNGRLLHKILYLSDKHYRKNLRKYVDIIISTSNNSVIYNIVNIPYSNGVNVNVYKIKKTSKLKKPINILGLANIAFWHGYDRIIKGLKAYTKEENVVFHIVGEGKEKTKLIKLVKKLNLNDKVIFHGFKTGKELDEIFDKVHFGVDALGGHRVGFKEQMALKVREYAARGIPFILSTYDPDFPPELDFVKYVPSNDEPINIEEVIKWYKELVNKYGEKLPYVIRKYAEENLTWEIKLKPVVEKIKELLKQKGVNT